MCYCIVHFSIENESHKGNEKNDDGDVGGNNVLHAARRGNLVRDFARSWKDENFLHV